jgi:hypothetical protein
MVSRPSKEGKYLKMNKQEFIQYISVLPVDSNFEIIDHKVINKLHGLDKEKTDFVTVYYGFLYEYPKPGTDWRHMTNE